MSEKGSKIFRIRNRTLEDILANGNEDENKNGQCMVTVGLRSFSDTNHSTKVLNFFKYSENSFIVVEDRHIWNLQLVEDKDEISIRSRFKTKISDSNFNEFAISCVNLGDMSCEVQILTNHYNSLKISLSDKGFDIKRKILERSLFLPSFTSNSLKFHNGNVYCLNGNIRTIKLTNKLQIINMEHRIQNILAYELIGKDTFLFVLYRQENTSNLFLDIFKSNENLDWRRFKSIEVGCKDHDILYFKRISDQYFILVTLESTKLLNFQGKIILNTQNKNLKSIHNLLKSINQIDCSIIGKNRDLKVKVFLYTENGKIITTTINTFSSNIIWKLNNTETNLNSIYMMFKITDKLFLGHTISGNFYKLHVQVQQNLSGAYGSSRIKNKFNTMIYQAGTLLDSSCFENDQLLCGTFRSTSNGFIEFSETKFRKAIGKLSPISDDKEINASITKSFKNIQLDGIESKIIYSYPILSLKENKEAIKSDLLLLGDGEVKVIQYSDFPGGSRCCYSKHHAFDKQYNIIATGFCFKDDIQLLINENDGLNYYINGNLFSSLPISITKMVSDLLIVRNNNELFSTILVIFYNNGDVEFYEESLRKKVFELKSSNNFSYKPISNKISETFVMFYNSTELICVSMLTFVPYKVLLDVVPTILNFEKQKNEKLIFKLQDKSNSIYKLKVSTGNHNSIHSSVFKIENGTPVDILVSAHKRNICIIPSLKGNKRDIELLIYDFMKGKRISKQVLMSGIDHSFCIFKSLVSICGDEAFLDLQCLQDTFVFCFIKNNKPRYQILSINSESNDIQILLDITLSCFVKSILVKLENMNCMKVTFLGNKVEQHTISIESAPTIEMISMNIQSRYISQNYDYFFVGGFYQGSWILAVDSNKSIRRFKLSGEKDTNENHSSINRIQSQNIRRSMNLVKLFAYTKLKKMHSPVNMNNSHLISDNGLFSGAEYVRSFLTSETPDHSTVYYASLDIYNNVCLFYHNNLNSSDEFVNWDPYVSIHFEEPILNLISVNSTVLKERFGINENTNQLPLFLILGASGAKYIVYDQVFISQHNRNSTKSNSEHIILDERNNNISIPNTKLQYIIKIHVLKEYN